MDNSRLLENLTWEQADKLLDSSTVLVVPIGSIEQHGPHLPLGTDYQIARYLAEGVAERCDSCVVTPTVPFGFAEYHSDFAGTGSVLREETLRAYLWEILQCYLARGVEHVLFLNSHGGNNGVLSTICHDLRNQGVLGGVVLWWDVIAGLFPERSPAGHADWIESSLMLHMNPAATHMDRALMPQHKELSNPQLEFVTPHEVVYRGVVVRVAMRTIDITATGNMKEPGLTPKGDPDIPVTDASEAIGRELADGIIGFVCDLVPQFARLRL